MEMIKAVDTRCQILRQKCNKFNLCCGSIPGPAGGGYSVPPDPLAGFTSKGRGKGGVPTTFFCRSTPMHLNTRTSSLHWLKIEQRIQYKLISLTYKVLTTSQPIYLHNLISLQSDNNTRSSDVVTFARPSLTSSLKITDRSFQYASPHLCNKLPFSLHESVSPPYAYLNPSFSSPLSPSITPSLFHCKLKT